MKDPIEEALEKLRPAEMRPELMARLTAARPQPPAPGGGWFRRWLLPLAAGACAAIAAFAWFRASEPPAVAPAMAAVAPLPIERQDYLLGAREVGVVVAPNERAYRVVEIEWLEQDTIRPAVDGPAVRVETKRREVVPVALEIF